MLFRFGASLFQPQAFFMWICFLFRSGKIVTTKFGCREPTAHDINDKHTNFSFSNVYVVFFFQEGEQKLELEYNK